MVAVMERTANSQGHAQLQKNTLLSLMFLPGEQTSAIFAFSPEAIPI